MSEEDVKRTVQMFQAQLEDAGDDPEKVLSVLDKVMLYFHGMVDNESDHAARAYGQTSLNSLKLMRILVVFMIKSTSRISAIEERQNSLEARLSKVETEYGQNVALK